MLIFEMIINYCFYKKALRAGVIVLNVHILLNKGQHLFINKYLSPQFIWNDNLLIRVI